MLASVASSCAHRGLGLRHLRRAAPRCARGAARPRPAGSCSCGLVALGSAPRRARVCALSNACWLTTLVAGGAPARGRGRAARPARRCRAASRPARACATSSGREPRCSSSSSARAAASAAPRPARGAPRPRRGRARPAAAPARAGSPSRTRIVSMRPGDLEAELRLGRLDRARGRRAGRARRRGAGSARRPATAITTTSERDDDAGIRLHAGFSGVGRGRRGARARRAGARRACSKTGQAARAWPVTSKRPSLRVQSTPAGWIRPRNRMASERAFTSERMPAEALALPDDVGHAVEVAREHAEQPLAALGVADVVVVGQHDARQRAVAADELHVALEQPVQRLDRVVGLGARRRRWRRAGARAGGRAPRRAWRPCWGSAGRSPRA